MHAVWRRTGPQGHNRPGCALQGVRLGEEGTSRAGSLGCCQGIVGRIFELGRLFGLGLVVGRCRVLDIDRRHLRCQACGAEDVSRCRCGDLGRLTEMAPATDWITLAEAAEILAATNIHFTPATIGGWARAGHLQSIKLGGRRFVRRGEVRALVAAPRRVRAEDVQPVLFEDWGG